MNDTSLGEIFDSLQKYDSDDIWDKFLSDEFFRYDKPTRVQILMGLDKMMSEEVRPNRTTAMWLNRQREAEAMHRRLEFAGR